MNKKEQINKILEGEIEKYASKPYQELYNIDESINYELVEGEIRYQVEIQIVEKEDNYVHVIVSVDDGGWRAFVPPTKGFLVYKDGRVDK